MYEPSDPRSKLASTAEAISAADDAVFARFYDMPPHETSEQADVWYARGHNFIAVYIDARSGVVFTRRNQIDEYVKSCRFKSVTITRHECPQAYTAQPMAS